MKRNRVAAAAILLPAAVFCLLAGPVFSGPPQSGADDVIAVRAGRIETVTRGVIKNGIILIRDGLIEAVGTDVEIPAGAEVIAADSLFVYPGFIDAFSSIALKKTQADEGAKSGDAARRTAPRPALLESARLAADMIDPEDAAVKTYREAGITAVLTVPDNGIFTGRAALINLCDTDGCRFIAPLGPQHIGYRAQRDAYPSTLMAVIAFQRQTLLDAQHRKLVTDRYARSPRGVSPPAYDPALDALVPVAAGEQQVLISAGTENEIKRAVALGREFGLDLVVNGAAEGFRVVPHLRAAGAPVIVTLDFPEPEQVTGYAYELITEGPSRPGASAADTSSGKKTEKKGAEGGKKAADKDHADLYGNAAALTRAGLTISFSSQGLKKPSEYLANIRKAVEYGLDTTAALRAMTINPARLFGAGEAAGSIEPGKLANLVISTADIFSDSAAVKYVFVCGEKTEVPEKKKQAPGAKPAVNVSGSWSITIASAMGEFAAVLELVQQGGDVSGMFLSEMGDTEIKSGSVSGSTVSFSLDMPAGGGAMEIFFSGTVESGAMKGTVDLGEMGSAEWEAVKPRMHDRENYDERL